MTFLTLVGGVVVFGLLGLFVPHVSFVVTLSMLLRMGYDVKIFPNHEDEHGWNTAATFAIIIAVIASLFLDLKAMSMSSTSKYIVTLLAG